MFLLKKKKKKSTMMSSNDTTLNDTASPFLAIPASNGSPRSENSGRSVGSSRNGSLRSAGRRRSSQVNPVWFNRLIHLDFLLIQPDFCVRLDQIPRAGPVVINLNGFCGTVQSRLLALCLLAKEHQSKNLPVHNKHFGLKLRFPNFGKTLIEV